MYDIRKDGITNKEDRTKKICYRPKSAIKTFQQKLNDKVLDAVYYPEYLQNVKGRGYANDCTLHVRQKNSYQT